MFYICWYLLVGLLQGTLKAGHQGEGDPMAWDEVQLSVQIQKKLMGKSMMNQNHVLESFHFDGNTIFQA